jgi:hypothetical protein
MGAEKIVATAQREDRELARARMRRTPKGFERWLLGCTGAPGLVLGAFGIAALGLSCRGQLSEACEELGTCAPAARADANADGPADAGTADVSVEGLCDPTGDPKDEPCVLDDAYGVFVAARLDGDAGPDGGEAGTPSGDGTMSSPYSTIGQALANLGSKTRVYVCNGVYGEQLSITTAVSVYGGLSCATGSAAPVWTYVGGSAQVSSPSASYALSVTGVSSGAVTVEDMSFAAPDATAPGTSSIAALVSSSSVNMMRVTLSAGSGANGAAGADGSMPNYSGAAPVGGAQAWTTINGLFSAQSGGTGSVNQCKTSGTSAGGNGALGCATAAAMGTPGSASPEPPVTAPGRDGLPMGSPLPGGVVSSNDPGADGQAGSGGAAAPAQVYGALAASGWTPSPGGSGTTGNPGQGGAGATDPLYGQCAVAAQDIGGGGGGAGGCGGAGGIGGGGGGASVALATLDSTVTLTACILNASDAGTGGAGGAGQDGQGGAAGGDDMSFSGMHAAGAAGGNGAGGSGGAGGTGGISVGILESGSTVMVNMAATASTSLGAAGAGGAAGLAGRHGVGILPTGVDGNSGASGSAGTAVAVLSLM